MAYNTKPIIKDVDGNPISQYYDPITDSYKPVEGSGGGNKVNVENNQGLSLIPILDKLSQLTGTVIDEETRKSNETTRKSNESSRVSVESDRVSAENTRVGNENTRKSNETSRKTAETGRVNKEGERVNAESGRVSEESVRVSSENTRVVNEDTRQSQESTRQSNESVREDNEGTRKSNETTRGQNESIRESQESTRQSQENTRQTNEGTRKSNETTRINNETTRQSNETVRENNMAIVQTWIDNPEQFDGRDLEFNWQGTSLGVRLEGDSQYIYIDLKGEIGSIENLTSNHITTALGYNPISPTQLNSKVQTDVPSGAKFTDTITTKTSELTNDSGFLTSVTKADVGLSNVDNIKQMPISGGVLENYREKLTTVSASGGSINLSLGNVFQHTPSGNITYSMINAVNGQAHSFTLVINMGATARTLTFPASVKWQGEEIPDLSGTSKTYVLTFMTVDGGTNWLGMFGGEF